jgi:hypothetical protein
MIIDPIVQAPDVLKTDRRRRQVQAVHCFEHGLVLVRRDALLVECRVRTGGRPHRGRGNRGDIG